MITIEDAIKAFPKRPQDCHKGDYGHALIVAGSAGYSGAAYLTSQAAARSGAGLVTLVTAKSLYPIMAAKLNEVMVRPFFETRDLSLSLLAEKDISAFSAKCDAIAIGPGISRNKETQHLVRNLMHKLDKPVVLDADGINAFSGHLNLIKSAIPSLVLTPHTGEMSRLIEKDVSEIENHRKELALEFANEYNTVLVLKGQNTIVAAPGGEFYINETGNPGMASGGTGDVLTGMITSFIAQGATTMNASILGVYFHGLAGDIAFKKQGTLSLLASDILEALPEALKMLA